MSHNIEIVNGKANMAYAGETPWHGLGKLVPNDLTPRQMLEAAGLDWTVSKQPLYAKVDEEYIQSDKMALVRDSDKKILDIVSESWNPLQNEQAFDFFHSFVMDGDMDMHTAGSLNGGNIIWALAKIKREFVVGKKDVVESHMLFTNPHQFGKSIDIRLTPIRVVCNNTLSMALSGSNTNVDKQSHRAPFSKEKVMMTLGIADKMIDQYSEAANLLARKKIHSGELQSYFGHLFPAPETRDTSRNYDIAMQVFETQPGAELNEGSWWQAFNAVTYMTDHILCKTDNNRLRSAWFGSNKDLKIRALDDAIAYANVSGDL